MELSKPEMEQQLELLFDFYMETDSDHTSHTGCPFMLNNKDFFEDTCCNEGQFPLLEGVNCPCEQFGKTHAILCLKQTLINFGYIED